MVFSKMLCYIFYQTAHCNNIPVIQPSIPNPSAKSDEKLSEGSQRDCLPYKITEELSFKGFSQMLVSHYARIFQELLSREQVLVDQQQRHYYRYYTGSTVREGKKKKEGKGKGNKKLWRNRFSAYPVCGETKHRQTSK